MAIVMGLDQHRAQITAEWMDTETGEVARARVSPAHRGWRARVPASGSPASELEVALEATTGWRFVVEELRRGRRGRASRRAGRDRGPARATRSAPRPTAPTRATCASC